MFDRYLTETKSFSSYYGQTVVLKVAMSCGGCSGAVKRVLTKMEGYSPLCVYVLPFKVTNAFMPTAYLLVSLAYENQFQPQRE